MKLIKTLAILVSLVLVGIVIAGCNNNNPPPVPPPGYIPSWAPVPGNVNPTTPGCNFPEQDGKREKERCKQTPDAYCGEEFCEWACNEIKINFCPGWDSQGVPDTGDCIRGCNRLARTGGPATADGLMAIDKLPAGDVGPYGEFHEWYCDWIEAYGYITNEEICDIIQQRVADSYGDGAVGLVQCPVYDSPEEFCAQFD